MSNLFIIMSLAVAECIVERRQVSFVRYSNGEAI
jgi:hypothetical protein